MDYSDQLRRQMQQTGLVSLKALCAAAQVSPGSVRRLRNGQLPQMRLDTLLKLSRALDLSLTELIQQFSTRVDGQEKNAVEPTAPQSLAPQPQPPEARSPQQFQRLSLQVLESWLLQWPTALYAIQNAAQTGEDIPASRVVPLVAPVIALIQSWGVVAIGDVGQEVPYDPRVHQLMAGQAQLGEPVRVRYVGYRQADTLLHRAKVSPIPLPEA